MVEKKILILGYDGLEIGLVEKFDLQNLKQKEYGKTNIAGFTKIATPILWGSFLTGQNLEEKFVKEKGSDSLQRLLRPAYYFLKNRISPSLAGLTKESSKKIKLFQKTGGSIHNWNVKTDLGKKTIFDFVEKSVGINIPTYNKQRWSKLRSKSTMKEMLEGKISDSDYWNDAWDCFEKTKKELLDHLDNDLVMAWFKVADSIGHFWRTDEEKMREIYAALNDFAREANERFSGLTLIVADHGMAPLGKYGDHTNLNYGYYSSNQKLSLKNPKLTDFYEIIRDVMNEDFDAEKYSSEYIEESKREEFEGDEEEEIKKRLRDLGYFD